MSKSQFLVGSNLLSRCRSVVRATCLISLLIAGCAPTKLPDQPIAEGAAAKWADENAFQASDGFKLYIQSWPESLPSDPRGIIIALHGTSDHSGRFEAPAEFWAQHGLLTYAYDQRGFGDSNTDGVWPGENALAQDLIDFVDLIAKSHPGVPITLLGESLGGGVVLIALARNEFPNAIKRAVLVAPAVETRDAKGNFEKTGLWTAAHTVPALPIPTEGGFRGLSNDEKLVETILDDPKVRKTIRVDSLWGLADLMDVAALSADEVELPVMVIYGGEDTLISATSVLDMVTALKSEKKELCYFPNSGHLLLHEVPAAATVEDTGDSTDSQMPEVIWDAIADWQKGRTPNVC